MPEEGGAPLGSGGRKKGSVLLAKGAPLIVAPVQKRTTELPHKAALSPASRHTLRASPGVPRANAARPEAPPSRGVEEGNRSRPCPCRRLLGVRARGMPPPANASRGSRTHRRDRASPACFTKTTRAATPGRQRCGVLLGACSSHNALRARQHLNKSAITPQNTPPA